MPITSAPNGLWADALDPIVRKWFNQGFARRASLLPTMFNTQMSSRAYEEVSGIGAIGIEAWKNYNSSGQVSEADFDQGYKKTYTHVEYPMDFSIERKTIDDNQHREVFDIAARIGDSAAQFREVEGASVFNNAFSSSFLGGDGVALCSDSHPLSPVKSGTQDNKGTAALTKANVSVAREAMMAWTDDNGQKVAVTPTHILVPPSLEDEALEISKSLLDPTSANNTINVHAGRFQVIVWHYLTDTNNWFMLDAPMMKMHLDWFDRAPLTVGLRDGDDRTLRAYWRAYHRFSYGFSDWRWIYGNEVA
jgi:hypothetical protein